MLKKIRTDQLQLGMHLHALCGPWLSHPFWRTKFVLSDSRDLAAMRSSAVGECWIDTGKGFDTPVDAAPAAPPVAANIEPKPAEPPRNAPNTLAHTTLEQELEQATLLCGQAKQTVIDLFGQVRMGHALDAESCLPMVEAISQSVQRNSGALLGLVRLKSRDDYTYMHSVAVCTLMVALAQKMGLSEAEVREAGLAGMLHDVGKARMPLDVLNKPGKLTQEEYELMKRHSRIGHGLLVAGGVGSAIALDVCLRHHERPDGKGYPDGLSAEALGVHARMGAVCDVYDAITSRRPYKEPWGPAESISQMSEWTKAGQFDPMVFRAFVNCVGIYPVGSLVRLLSERLAVVIEQNKTSLVAPCVKVFYSIRSKMPVPVEAVDLARPGCRDRIVGRESNGEWRFPFLDELSIPGSTVQRRRTA